jgi:uncharacterized protein (TIGR02246 family)
MTASRCLVSTLLVLGAATAARPQDDDAAIRDVVRRYQDARERRDKDALVALFSSDADQLVSSGDWRRGRDAVVTGGLASSARGGSRALTVESVRRLGPDVAIADARYEISGLAGAARRNMWSTFVLARQKDGWRISAIRNMLPAPQ